MMARFWFSESTLPSSTLKKNVVNVGPPLTKLLDTGLLPHGAMGKSAVCDYGISWAYLIIFSQSRTYGSATIIIPLGVLWHIKY